MRKRLTRVQRDHFFKIYYLDALPVARTAKDAYHITEKIFSSIYNRRAYHSQDSWLSMKTRMLKKRTRKEILNSDYDDYSDITDEKTRENLIAQANRIKRACKDFGVDF